MTASSPRHVAVIDIGKTNAKLSLVDLVSRIEVAELKRPNRVKTDGLYPHHDVDALWAFILGGLATIRRDHPVDAISVTTHGATAALVDAVGELALPVLDYEHDGPDSTRNGYDAIRPSFEETGSPALPIGLNLGAQLYWQEKAYPELFARTQAILTWPQYWSWRLSGVMASEATSLGCHTDLWNPYARGFSNLVEAMNWRRHFPPMKPASSVLGPIQPGIAAMTGLDPTTPVVTGIHDSNASLLPHMIDREPPFSVVSTGTWVVVMAVGENRIKLQPARDTLINVNAWGDPVPSARFMGGREYELLMGDHSRQSDGLDLATVLESRIMLLPSTVIGSGPFPDARARWLGTEPQVGPRHAAVSLYLALMTATCLDLSGAKGCIVVEGPFATNAPYLAMLEMAAGRPVLSRENGNTGTSIGAALLARQVRSDEPYMRPDRQHMPEALRHYASRWRSEVASGT